MAAQGYMFSTVIAKQQLLCACLFLLYVFAPSSKADHAIKIHCSGKGPALYLIGGGPAFTSRNLEPVQRRLSGFYRVCRWDMRGVGDNIGLAIRSGQTALSQWIADMDQVLPQTPVMIWGHSWGALQSLLFAKQFPRRVSRLVLSNPVDPGLKSLEQIEYKRIHHSTELGMLELDDIGTPREALQLFRSKIASYFFNAEQGRVYASDFMLHDSNSALNIRIWEEYRDAPLGARDIQQLSVKIAGLIYCQYDVLQPENLSEYRRILPGSVHHIIRECGHFPWEEQPDIYFEAIANLFSGAK